MANSIEEFTTLWESTSPAWATSAEAMVNDVAANTYTLNRVVQAGNMLEMVQGGKEITDRVYLTAAGDASNGLQRYDIDDTFEYSMAQPGVNWTLPWAVGWSSVSWSKHDKELQVDEYGPAFRARTYKRVLFQKHQNMWTRVNDGLESECWAQPDQANMEAATPTGKRKPMSIPAVLNEHDNGLTPTQVDSGGTVWTTVQRVAPATYANWVPYALGGGPSADTTRQDQGYTYTAGEAGTTATLFPVLSRVYHKLGFHRLPKMPEYSEKRSSPQVIWCSLQGLINYEHALQMNQDTFRGIGKVTGQDPAYDGPTYYRAPLEWLESLDTATVYSDGAAAVDEAGNLASGSAGATAGIIGPRYYFVNTNYLKFFVHADNYCDMTPVFAPANQPFLRVSVMDIWNNLGVRSRRRLGMAGPKEDITNA